MNGDIKTAVHLPCQNSGKASAFSAGSCRLSMGSGWLFLELSSGAGAHVLSRGARALTGVPSVLDTPLGVDVATRPIDSTGLSRGVKGPLDHQ